MISEPTASKRVSLWRSLLNAFCRHDWAFALGVSPGIVTGNPRPLCFRRACTKCGKREEIEHYCYIFHCNGTDYYADPQWRASE